MGALCRTCHVVEGKGGKLADPMKISVEKRTEKIKNYEDLVKNLRATDPDRYRANEALIERFGITEYAGARVEKLSSGMKQKISIARTIVHDPPVLIFDEPTVGLDVMAAIEMQQVIRELRDEGKTIIFSTHIMSEAEKLCDRIAIIHQGRILALGTLEEHRQATGKHYLEDIFVQYVETAGSASR